LERRWPLQSTVDFEADLEQPSVQDRSQNATADGTGCRSFAAAEGVTASRSGSGADHLFR
jgi:hypothetical protein